MLAAQAKLYARDALLEMFWPGQPLDRSRRRLREELSRLRGELPAPELLVTTADTAGLASTGIYVDVRQYLADLDNLGDLPWRISDHAPLPLNLANQLSRCIKLWHGSSFLEGARLPSTPELDDWLVATDANLKARQVRLLRRLAWHHAASGELEQAVDFLEQAYLLDDLNEDIAAQIIRWRLDLGQRARAVSRYEIIRSRLDEEMGLSPGQELRELGRRLEAPDSNAYPLPGSPLSLRPTLMLPFVGRREHLQTLESALLTGGGVLIQGASGSGKTRLIHEFTTRRMERFRLLPLRCRLSGMAIPLHPLGQILRDAVQPEEWLALNRPWLNILSYWLPELQQYSQDQDIPPELYSQQARAQLQEAVRQVFLTLSRSSQLILIVDDVQWADEATIDTLAYLLEHPPFENQSLLLLSWRDEIPNPHLEAWLPHLQASQNFQQLKLGGLEEENIVRLCRYIFRQEASAHFTTALMQATSGNPFFVLETLRSMLEQGLSPNEPPVEIPTPHSVRELLLGRLQLVSVNGSRLLAAAAVLGALFDLNQARLVAEISPLPAAQAVEELEQRALIEAHPEIPGSYIFTHDRIRETIADSLHPVRRKMLHQKAFEVLKGFYQNNLSANAALLADHAEQAGLVSAAFDHWVTAGRHAFYLFSPEEAESAFQRAEALLDQHLDQIQRDQIHQLYALWSDLTFDLNKAEQLFQMNNRLLEIGQQRSDPLLIGVALDGLSDACMATNQFERGLEYAQQAAQYLTNTGDTFELTEAIIHEAVFQYMLNRLPVALQKLQQAQSYATEIRDRRITRSQSLIHFHQAMLYTLMGQPSRGFFEALLAQEFAIQSQDPYNRVQALSMLAFSGFFTGQAARAVAYANQGIDLAIKLQHWRMLSYLTGYRSMNALVLGNLKQASEDALQVQELGAQSGHHEIISFGCRLEGDLSSLLGNWQAACELYRKGIDYGSGSFWTLDNMFRLGAATARGGAVEQGLALIRQAIHQSQQSNLLLIEVVARSLLSDLYLHADQFDAAEQEARWIVQTCQKICFPAISQAAHSTLSLCLARRGQLEPARKYARQAYEGSTRIGDRWIMMNVLQQQLQLAKTPGFTLLDEQELNQRKQSLRQELLAHAPDAEYTAAIKRMLA